MRAVIMAGGKGSRFTPLKPLLEVCGKPMILRVYEVLASFAEEVFVATVKGHPAEAGLLSLFPKVVYTSGRGYENDVLEVVNMVGVPLIVSSADLPFLPGDALSLLLHSCSVSICSLLDRSGFVGVSVWRDLSLENYDSVRYPGELVNVNTRVDYEKANKLC